MAVESAVDRAAFFNLNDWAVKGRYRNRGRVFPIVGIFDNAFVAVDVAEAPFSSSQPMFHIATASLPCRVQNGDTLYVNDAQYVVRDFQHDGTGITVLRLEVSLDYDLDLASNLETEAAENLVTEAGFFILQEA